jgi:aldose 1-epimerase
VRTILETAATTNAGRAWVGLLPAMLLAIGCAAEPSSTAVKQRTLVRLQQGPYGRTPDNQLVEKITLRNLAGVEVTVITLGGIITSIRTPDRTGAIDDIVLGFDTLEPYFDRSPYFGSIVGRYGNRIANGRFAIDGTTYTLAKNNGPNHLHGGVRGWDKVLWAAEPFQHDSGVGVKLSYVSADGEEGYPGQVKADVTYTLTDKSALVVDYHAVTNKATVINLTQHTYFNLAGVQASDVLAHELTIHADQFVPVDATLIPTGQFAPVDGTPFDFRTPHAIGARIDDAHEQIARGRGYDHSFAVKRTGPGLAPAARVVEPTTGRTLEVATMEPALQFYSGNFLDGTLTGKGGRTYPRRAGFCLETQHHPDSPNQPAFPSTVLRPGEAYRSQTVFQFGVAQK